jgi:predicted nucleic acid-binding protein
VDYLLDTDTCIYLLTGNQPDYQRNILARLDALPRNERPRSPLWQTR